MQVGRLWKKLGVVALIGPSLAAALIVGTDATPAAASQNAIYGTLATFTADGVHIRRCPYLSCQVLGEGFRGQNECASARVYGDYVNGDNIWVQFPYTLNVAGYSTEVYMVIHYGTQCVIT
jgi:hypothetical protein